MNKEIVESVVDHFKNKYESLTILAEHLEWPEANHYYSIIDFKHKLLVARICIWFIESENIIDLCLYNNNNILSDYRWDVNDPKCILEIEEHIEKHISHIE